MKKNYFKILVSVLTLGTSGELLNAQCVAPSAPAVSGTTLAACTNSAAFTLTGTTTGTNVIGWYKNSYGGDALSTNNIYTTPTVTQTTTYYVGQSNSTSLDTLALPTQTSVLVNSAVTRGFFFTAPHDFVITGLRVPLSVGGTSNSAMAVFKLSNAPTPGLANAITTFSTLYLNQSITGTNVVAVHIPIHQGDVIGVMGKRGDESSYGANAYTSTLGIAGATVTLDRLGSEYDIFTTTIPELWTETTNYIARVEVYTSRGCNSTLTPVTVSLVPTPTVVVNVPQFVCANSPYTLTATGATSYTWSGGPQSSSYVVTPAANTTYSVTGSVQGTCNSAPAIVAVNVQTSVPSLTASASTTLVCSGDPVTLTGSGSTTYSWTSPTGTVANAVQFFPMSTQVYTLSSSNSCGIGTKTINIVVNATPTLVTSATPTSVCEGQTATLTASGAQNYQWNNATAGGATFVITPTQSGFYNVTGISQGCPGTSSQAMVVYPNPTVNAVTNKTIVCAAGPATLSANGANTYSWNTGASTSVTVVNPAVSTIYTATGTYTSTGCSSTKTVEVVVFFPGLITSNSATVCYGSAITLTAYASANSTYSWSNGGGFASNNITATVPAVYTVTALTSTVGASNCKSTATLEIGIVQNPTISVSATKSVVCKGEKRLLTASGGSTYAWTALSPVTNTIEVGPTIINSITVYTVTGTDANGCASTATYAVKVDACTGIAELITNETLVNVYPNPSNGTFVIEVKSQMQLTLVNQLGQVVRELTFNQENNYKQNISELSNGIYFIKGLNNGSNIQNKIVVNK